MTDPDGMPPGGKGREVAATPPAATSHTIAPLDQLRAALLALHDALPTLANNPDALITGTVNLDTLVSDLRALRWTAKDMLATWMTTNGVHRYTVEGAGTAETRRTIRRTAWDSPAVLEQVVRNAIDPDGTGEIPDVPAMELVATVVKAIAECAPFTPSMGWRTTALRARGVDFTDLCNESPYTEVTIR